MYNFLKFQSFAILIKHKDTSLSIHYPHLRLYPHYKLKRQSEQNTCQRLRIPCTLNFLKIFLNEIAKS